MVYTLASGASSRKGVRVRVSPKALLEYLIQMKKELYIIADNIRSAQNVGAIFRSADGAGAKKIYLAGYSPVPFKEEENPYPTQAQKKIAKTALGAEKIVPWEKAKRAKEIIEKLKKSGVQIICLEKTDNSRNIFGFSSAFPCVLILGNETKGIDEEILKLADETVHIPMRGRKNSLNVSVAAGIAMYQILKY